MIPPEPTVPPGPDVMSRLAAGPARLSPPASGRFARLASLAGVFGVVGVVGFVGAAGVASAAGSEVAAAAHSTRPLAGVVRAAGRPVAGVTILLRATTNLPANGPASTTPFLTAITGSDGTFVVPDAAPGAYALLALVPGFLPAVKGIVHEGSPDRPDFVSVDLESRSRERILPVETIPGADPWSARALLPGDLLRERGPDSLLGGDDKPRDPLPVQPAVPGHPAEPAPATALAAAVADAGGVHPVRARVESLAGFGASGTAPRSRAALDVTGLLGERFRWGVEGAFDRLANPAGGAAGDGQRFAVEIGGAPPSGRASATDSLPLLRLATRRQNLPLDAIAGEESRYSAHSVDATLPTGASSSATVSARLVSQSNFGVTSPADSLFARDSRAVEVLARYNVSAEDGRFVRVSVAYRSDTSLDAVSGGSPVGPPSSPFQEARLGGSAGGHILDGLVVEGSLFGEIGSRSRGVVPELLLALEPSHGVRIYGAASRRFERTTDPFVAQWGWTGGEEDFLRLSRAVLRGGIRLDSPSGDGFTVEASHRQMGGTFRYLLDPDFFDRIDAVYLFPGDVVDEASASATFRLGEGVQGRLSGLGGRISGSGEPSAGIPSNEGSFGRGEAAVHIAATGTDLAVGYRVVFQSLTRLSAFAVRNDITAVDVTLSQTLPLRFLALLGTQWRVLFSLEAGTRREPDGEIAANRRLAGGLGLTF